MGGKQMEGNEEQKRQAAREARKEGKKPSEAHATTGSSQQREHLDSSEDDHRERIENIRAGKPDVIRENTPEPKPGYGEDQD